VTSSTVSKLASAVGPGVVGLRAGSRGGSGVVVGPGVAVTLARNIGREQLKIAVGGGDLDARVAGVDPAVDLAVLEFPAPDGVAELSWAADGALAIGDEVFAAADPSGRGLRVTAGAVSGAPYALRGPGGRLIEGAIEHTAPLPRGSGGGPLVDADGRILGLNAIRRGEGLIVAWPAAALRDRVAALASGEAGEPLRLGVALVDSRHARRLRAAVGLEPVEGLLVRAVEDRSAADRAGVLRGDVIVAVDGTDVSNADGLYAALDAARDGSDLALSLVRGSERVELTAQLRRGS
jgi:serine protease Do